MRWSILAGLIVGPFCGWLLLSHDSREIDHVRSFVLDHSSEVGLVLDEPITVRSTHVQNVWEITFLKYSYYPSKDKTKAKRYVCFKPGLTGFKVLPDKIE